MSDRRVVLRNYEGFMSTYTQPTDYRPHEAATCSYCQSRFGDGTQEGVAGLLAGHTPTIAPENWRAVHQRTDHERPVLEVGSCFGDNGCDRPESEPDIGQQVDADAQPAEVLTSGSNGRED
jgi:lysine 2,3-aminomutase